MKINIILDEKDIAKIISDHYGTTNVKIFVQKECEGYGPMEHEVTKVRAEVVVPNEFLKS